LATKEDSNNSILYQGLFRVYRNAVVSFLRVRLTAAYHEEWEEQLRKPLLKEWDGVIANAKQLRSRGILTAEPSDAADYLSLNHFYPIFEAHIKTLWPVESQDPVWRQNVLTWSRQTKHIRDAIAHPTTEDLTFNDAYVPLDAARRLLNYVNPEAANRIAQLQRQLRSERPPEPGDALLTLLPPREDVVLDFIGRGQILADLNKWFIDPQSRRWLLCGDGGKGKTAIAYEFATRVAAAGSADFTLVVWLSAKQRRFVDGVTMSASPDFVDLAGAVRRLLEAYGMSDEVILPDAVDTLLRLLDELPALIIVDDVDTLSGSAEAANEFLALRVPTTHSKVLFTSRRVPLGMGAAATIVSGLSGEEGRAFVASRIKLFGIEPARMAKLTIEKVLDVTDGSPLYIEDLLRLVKTVSPAQAVRGWEQRGGLAARKYALEREVELLTPDARKVLLTLALVEGSASIDELVVTTNISTDAAIQSLDELGKLFLVPQPSLFEDQERYTLNRNTRSLITEVLGGTHEAKQIKAAIRHVWGQGSGPRDTREVGALCRQAVLLVRSGRESEAEALLTAALEGDYPSEPRLLGQLAWVYKKSSPARVAEAREFFRRAAELRTANPDTYWHWASMEREQGQWDEALRIASLGLAHTGAEHSGLLVVAALSEERRAADLSAALQEDRGVAALEAAANYLQRAAECRDSGFRAQELSKVYAGQVRLARKRGRIDRIDTILRAWAEALPTDVYLKNEIASRAKGVAYDDLSVTER
jgi:tetratricopeptide (TPR) repeat protein